MPLDLCGGMEGATHDFLVSESGWHHPRPVLGQKRYDEAEPLLRAGYERMKRWADKVPLRNKVRLGEALDRPIAFAEATDKSEDEKRWKDEKAKLPAAAIPRPGPEKK